ncbi:MAG: hypothetical protein DI582_03055 [Azospirillum brasilense]|nr:MAG: hypothetical protein DI582_03055 [Azospirillum brasilense]
MSRERYHYATSRTTARPATQRAVVTLLILTGLTLLALSRAQHPSVVQVRLQMLEMLRPAMQVASQPVTATRKLAASTGEVLDAAEENRRLRAENETLRHWQSVAQAMKAENTALRKLMAYQPVEHASYVTARVIGQSPASFGQYITINAGSAEGIKPLQPVTDAYGLVGRTLEVAEHTTRVMLLNDAASRVPVVMGTTRQRAILTGNGNELLRLSFMHTENAALNLGEPVVTTQEGDLIPGGIAVGQVFKKDAAGYLIKPLRPLAQAEYLRVVISTQKPASPAQAEQPPVPLSATIPVR